MNLIFRFLKTVLLFLINPTSRPLLAISKISFRVWPNDLDTNLHMNNGRYLTLLDLGRLDLLLHLGAGKILFKERWAPVLASMEVRFRRPLNLFQKFEIETRLVCWDAKWIFLEQKMWRKGDLILHAYLKGVFVGPKGSVPVKELLNQLNLSQNERTQTSPPMPDAIKHWIEAEAKMVQDEKLIRTSN